MRKFENCDVLAVLHEIMLHNTEKGMLGDFFL